MITAKQALEIFKKEYPNTKVLWIREHENFYSFERRSSDGHSLITGGIPVIDKKDGHIYGVMIWKEKSLDKFKKINLKTLI